METEPTTPSRTTGIVAVKNGRSYIGIGLNPERLEITKKRYDCEIPQAAEPVETVNPPTPIASIDYVFE
jgi:DNA modification methylase